MKLQCMRCKNTWNGKLNDCCPLHDGEVGVLYVRPKLWRSKVVYGIPAGMGDSNHGYYTNFLMGGKVLAHKTANK